MKTYQNPVYNRDFPDPFVLKFCGEYWAYCTGLQPDGRCFGVLHSRDLIHWEALPGAMEPLPDGHTHYWAPEVVYDNGRFLMYYSAGNEEQMQIRVAVAEHPAGPFVDSGRRLTTEPFAIDPHVLVDDDGARYLFYATDFLDHTHIGTGTVRDRMLDPFTLAGAPQPVTRPRYDWHVFDPQRAAKGGVRWHTIEGSFVLKHKGRYYQMFSGGNWQNPTYGVSYAIASSPAIPDEWQQVADGERVLPILRSIPGEVVGPGHNSVVRGPDNQQLYCVYHRWAADGSGRVMAIDPLDWAGERMFVLGPSTTPQPAPLEATFADQFDREVENGLGVGWQCDGGTWMVEGGAALQRATDASAMASCLTGADTMIVEVSARALGGSGSYGLAFCNDQHAVAYVTIAPARRALLVSVRATGSTWGEQLVQLPPDFVAEAYHLLRVEASTGHMRVRLDERDVWHGTHLPAQQVALYTHNSAAAFAGFALTVGWEDDFMQAAAPAECGWRTTPAEAWHLNDQRLRASSTTGEALAIRRAGALNSYELVVSARLDRLTAGDGGYGVLAAVHSPEQALRVQLRRESGGWALVCRIATHVQVLPLPDHFDPYIFQQLRFRKHGRQLAIQWEAHQLGVVDVPEGPARVGLSVHNAEAAFDSVRLTKIAAHTLEQHQHEARA